MQPTIKAYDESTWVLDDKVGAASKYNYDAYGYGVYYDDIHGDISASNPLLVNNNLERNTLVDRIFGPDRECSTISVLFWPCQVSRPAFV